MQITMNNLVTFDATPVKCTSVCPLMLKLSKRIICDKIQNNFGMQRLKLSALFLLTKVFATQIQGCAIPVCFLFPHFF